MLARSCLVLAFGVVVLAGCGEDDKESAPEVPGDPTGSGNPTSGNIDGGASLDASADASILPDGRVVLPDGGSPDAGCDVSDPQLGCGQVRGTWVRYASGLEVDRASGLAWAPAQAPSGRHGEDAWAYCQQLSIAGVDEFDLPTIDQVRTLAAGCADALVGGSCKVADRTCVGAACGLDATTCKACEVGKGPHASGGYCRPELGECVTAWALTGCDDNGIEGCPEGQHQHWFYDVRTGGFGLSKPDSQLGGRCVARVGAPAPSPAPAPAPAPVPAI